MKRKLSRLQLSAIALALIVAGAWFLYKPVVSIVHLAQTGNLPVLVIRKSLLAWIWFEQSVDPLSFEGFKSWFAYAMLAFFGAGSWIAAAACLFDKLNLGKVVLFSLLWFYLLCAAGVLLMIGGMGLF